MARAVPTALLGLVEDDAAEVSALLAEGHDLGVGEPHEDRWIGFRWVTEEMWFADLYVGERDDRLGFAGVLSSGFCVLSFVRRKISMATNCPLRL